MYFKKQEEFVEVLEQLINECGIDNECNTPDYILANYILQTLITYKKTRDYITQHHNDNDCLGVVYKESNNATRVEGPMTAAEYAELEERGQILDDVIYIIK